MLSLVLHSQVNAMDVTFTDVAGELGLNYSGPTFGQSFGDYDRDGFEDIYLNGHGEGITIFKNDQGLGFIDQITNITSVFDGDTHGGAWGDLDNDGDRDLMFVEGANRGTGYGPNHLLLNSNGTFADIAQQAGVVYGESRGRMAAWFDWNLDGKLDLALANWARNDGSGETSILTQQDDSFVFDNPTLGFSTSLSNNFFGFIDIDGYPEPLLMVHTVIGFSEGLYDTTQLPFVNVRQATGLPQVFFLNDFAVADFTGDLKQDIFFVRSVDRNEVVQVTDEKIHGRIHTHNLNAPAGYSFSGPEVVEFNLGPPSIIDPTEIYIGANGYSPKERSFSLDRTNFMNIGAPTSLPSDEFAATVFFDQASNKWVVMSQGGVRLDTVVSASSALSDVETIGFTSQIGARTALLHERIAGGFASTPESNGLTESYSCSSVVAADFDNDMDQDIYMACASNAVNRQNVLLENNGSGVFTQVVDAAGAVGTLEGLSDAVVSADFNNDGFVDLLVSNGKGSPLYSTGPMELFENSGNDNHWLHVDLIGTTANRDGVGARVEVEAGGFVQRRWQDGGTHRYAQDSQRLHFGLASNTSVSRVTVRWPGGQIQQINNVAVDQILSIVQPSDSDGDGIDDAVDNCSAVANPSQLDSDLDGFGNRCDPDLNNDLIVNFEDLYLFSEAFFTADIDADFDQNGTVNFLDLTILANYFLSPPGPSGVGFTIN